MVVTAEWLQVVMKGNDTDMEQINKHFTYTHYTSSDELAPEDRNLLSAARDATKLSYSPYSKFRVGAAAMLNNKQLVLGSNQENASFGATICAERVLLSTLSSAHPGTTIVSLAVSYVNSNSGQSDTPISPCGICRQSLLEHENIHKQTMRIILGGASGAVWIIESAATLLPLAFSSHDLS